MQPIKVNNHLSWFESPNFTAPSGVTPPIIASGVKKGLCSARVKHLLGSAPPLASTVALGQSSTQDRELKCGLS